jgi:hypothetical protein
VGPLVRDLVHDGPGLRSGRLRREQWIGGRHAAAPGALLPEPLAEAILAEHRSELERQGFGDS